MKYFIGLFLLFSAQFAFADSIGPKFPSTCVDSAISSGQNWQNVTNAMAEDGIVAVSTNATSTIAQCSGYGFGLSANTIIDGIYVEFKRDSNSGDDATDNSVRVYKSGTATGTDKANSASNWTAGTLTWNGYGGSADLWGTTWTAADIDDSGFGSGLSGTKNAGGINTYNLDAERITIYFHYIPLKTQIRNGVLREAVLR